MYHKLHYLHGKLSSVSRRIFLDIIANVLVFNTTVPLHIITKAVAHTLDVATSRSYESETQYQLVPQMSAQAKRLHARHLTDRTCINLIILDLSTCAIATNTEICAKVGGI